MGSRLIEHASLRQGFEHVVRFEPSVFSSAPRLGDDYRLLACGNNV